MQAGSRALALWGPWDLLRKCEHSLGSLKLLAPGPLRRRGSPTQVSSPVGSLNTDLLGCRAGEGPGLAGLPWQGTGFKNFYLQLRSKFPSKSLVYGRGFPTAQAQQQPSGPPQKKAWASPFGPQSVGLVSCHKLAQLSHLNLGELARGGQHEQQWKVCASMDHCARLSSRRAQFGTANPRCTGTSSLFSLPALPPA